VSSGGAPSHGEPLRALGIDSAATHALDRYLGLLASWSPRVNLTAAASPAERVDLLVAPVLPAAGVPGPGELLVDVGSGNGSPGLVLALLRPDLRVALLEPRLKRWAFLREATRSVGRPDVEVRRERHDQYGGPPADVVALRAVALGLGALRPLLRHGGRVLAFGAGPGLEAGFVREGAVGGVAQLFRECST
jgi:16S rRNA (guanine527-N7)-methyltransferase